MRVVAHELDEAVTRHVVALAVLDHLVDAVQIDISRSHERLRHARVAVLELLVVGHGLVSGLVLNLRAVGHQVVVHQPLGGAVAHVAERELDAVAHEDVGVEAHREDRLLGVAVFEDEIFAVGGVEFERIAFVERIFVLLHDGPCGVGGQLEEIVGRDGHPVDRLVGDAVVFAEGAFVERGAGLHGAGGVFAQAVERVARPVVGQVRDGAVEVLHDLLHHESAAVARPFERSPVVRRNHEVVIGDVAVFAHLFEVEQRAEEIGHAVVALADSLVRAVARTFEVVVDVTQVGPCACAPVFGGRGARALLYGAEVLGDLDVGDLNGIGVGTCEETVEAVGPKLQLRFARKERIGRKVRFRLLGQEVVAARQRQTHRNEYQYFADSFHG